MRPFESLPALPENHLGLGAHAHTLSCINCYENAILHRFRNRILAVRLAILHSVSLWGWNQPYHAIFTTNQVETGASTMAQAISSVSPQPRLSVGPPLYCSNTFTRSRRLPHRSPIAVERWTLNLLVKPDYLACCHNSSLRILETAKIAGMTAFKNSLDVNMGGKDPFEILIRTA